MKALKTLVFLAVCAAFGLIAPSGAHPGMKSGDAAPVFSLQDTKGAAHNLAQMQGNSIIVLYFFDARSKPSQDGLASLTRVAGKYTGADLKVWAISASPKEHLVSFVSSSATAFPVLADTAGVCALYGAEAVLPTMCIIGPELKVLDYFQGGGKTTEMMLVRLAERELSRKQTQLAKAIGEEVVKKDPKNAEARAIEGHAALKGGEVQQAERVFVDMAKKGGESEILGKEGLAAVHARKGETEKAMQLASEVERKAPRRSYPHVVKGDILYAQNKRAEARAEFKQAIEKKDGASFQKAVGYNKLARMDAGAGKNEAARKLYDEAVAIDPYYVEATTNKGITYEKEGKWDKALETYRKASSVDRGDFFASVLARKAQEMIDAQRDAHRKDRTDKLVKELAERYRSRKKTDSAPADEWTSRPMVLTFVDFQERGGLAERDGMASVLAVQLSDYLNTSKRVQVVERAVMERLLEELNLGSSELADQETALRLGKVLAAKLIGTGSLNHLPGATMMTLRMIDSETSAVSLVQTREISAQPMEKELLQLNREILKMIISKYPLRGYVVKADSDDRVILNIGAKQGVVSGTSFDVLGASESIEFKGKRLQSAPKAFATVKVVRVEPDLCYAQVVSKERPLRTEDRIQEKLETSGGRDASL